MKSLSRVIAQNVQPTSLPLGQLSVLENNTALIPPSTLPPARLGQLLVKAGDLSPGDLTTALALQARQNTRLESILLAHGMVSEEALLQLFCTEWDTHSICPLTTRPDPRLIRRYTPARCLKDGILPWRKAGSITVIATHRPDLFERHRATLEELFGRVAMTLCTESDLVKVIASSHSPQLIQNAETRLAYELSCRLWQNGAPQRNLFIALCCISALAIAFPIVTFGFLTCWAIATLAFSLSLKLSAFGIGLRKAIKARNQIFTTPRAPTMAIARLPLVSVMVPLLKEESIADKLVRRISRIDYPKELLDICLVVEQSDEQTRKVLAKTDLPPWMRVIIVPSGDVQTKPRALNYAFNFCRGNIVGIWDAEDAPAPDQIHKVVRRFRERGPDLACVQGQLDFYNTGANWLSRCFTIEYASWFRVMLPALEQLGFAIPLGGTTLFFRRDTLEKIDKWDAHNVTEDADLGIRLARCGYRTEMIESVTLEEANCRAVPWVKQRSRWIKGYAITYAVHMNDPVRLWRDLGPWKFLGFQITFMATLSQFLLAPILWTFWLALTSIGHPLIDATPAAVVTGVAAFFIFAECTNIGVGLIGVRATGRRKLMAWVPTTMFYFPMGTIAAYKALWELITSPFYWDKTSHGHHDENA